jgi:hypothetical protein
MKIDRKRLLVWTINLAAAVYIVFFVVALFFWFIPFLSGPKFMVYEEEYDEQVFRWFARSVPQIERDAFAAYIIFGFPLMVVFSYSAFYTLRLFVFPKIRRQKK